MNNTMKKVTITLLLLVMLSTPAFAGCIMGWFCKDAFHRGYRNSNCEWVQIEYCPHGCQSGQCTPEPNNAPSIPEVNISPDPALTENDLVCHAFSEDPENDPIEYTYKWYRNSDYYKTNISSSETDTLPSTHTSEGENWMCKVRAFDQSTYSNYGYDEITISTAQQCTPGWKCKDAFHKAYQNADCTWSNEEFCQNGCLNGECIGVQQNNAPTDPDVEISPSSPEEGDDLSCYAYSDDLDGDTLTYHFTWKQDGHIFRTHSTHQHTDSIDGSRVDEGEEWQCKVRAFDGVDYSDYSVDTVIVSSNGNHECDFDLLIDPDYSSVHMEKNDSTSISVKLKNTSDCRQCFDLYAENNSVYIDSDVSRDRVCLNEGESTWIALDIETIDAKNRTYSVELIADKGLEEESSSVEVMVSGGCDSCTDRLDLITYRKNICRDEKDNIRVLVKNRSDEIKTVELSASSTEFLASFDNDEIEVDAHSEKYVDLEVYVYPGTSLGSHYVNVYARTDEDYVKEKAYFTVKECEEPEEDSFSLSMSGTCISLEKGDDRNIPFTLKNKTGSKLTVHLQTVADIPTEVQGTITLNAHQSKTVRFWVKARKDDEPKKHYIKLYAWTAKHREMKKACVKIEKLRKTIVSIEENKLSIEQGENNIFVLLIENRGDYNEDYEIEVNNSTEANVTLSQEEFELKKGEGKEIFINVDIPLDIELGEYSFDILVKNKETFTKTLNFTVTKAVEPEPAIVKLTSYPSKIVVLPGEEKMVSLALTNFSSEKISGIKVDWSMPSFVFVSDSTVSLEGEETGIIEQAVRIGESAVPDTYYGFLTVKFNGKKITKEITIIVVEPETYPASTKPEKEDLEEEGEFLPFAGLISLTSPAGLGLIILLIIVIVMVALKGVIESDTNYTKPVWHRR